MIGSLLKEIPPISDTKKTEIEDGQPPEESNANDSLMSALPVVEKIVRHKTRSWRTEASDLVQGIFLKLLKWQKKYRTKRGDRLASDES